MPTRKFPKSRKLIMFLGDLIIISVAYIIATAIIFNSSLVISNISYYSGILPLLAVLTVLLLNINGLYSLEYKVFAEILLSLLVTNICTFVLMQALGAFFYESTVTAIVIALAIVFQMAGMIIWRHLFWRLECSLHECRSVLLIGSEEECNHVYNRLRQQPQLEMKLKYVCTELLDNEWQQAAAKVDVILMCPEMRHRNKIKIINYCQKYGKQPLIIPNTFEIFCSGAKLDKIDDIPVFRLQSLHPSVESRLLKRLLDVAVSGIGFICALPFMIGTALAIKITDPGPIIYSQIRTGKDGREFKVYKFRTMKVDAEKYSGPMLAQENDPRITPTGRFLRAVRLDELPQIWNVLAGDMSIVGPRPERPFFVEKFTAETPEYAYRHNVKPGITGLAQVYGKYNTTPLDKLVYDLMYIQRCNIITDLIIIIQTVKVLFTKSATEGTGVTQKNLDMKKYGIGKDTNEDFKK